MKNNYKLSIITICLNEKDVEQTCQSIIGQNWQNFEWIVIDGGSDLECLEVLEKYKHRMAYFISEKDNGIYDAMNKGIRLATGEYLNFMNAGDCFCDENVLRDVFSVPQDAGVLYGNAAHWDKKRKCYQILVSPPVLTIRYFFVACINHQSSFIRRELFHLYGVYDEQFRIAADWEKWLCFKKQGVMFHPLARLIAVYGIHGISSLQKSVLEYEKRILIKRYSRGISDYLWVYARCSVKKFILKRIAQVTPVRHWRYKIRSMYKTGEYEFLESLTTQSSGEFGPASAK
jgi:glycosyltransferase involved in cell wall biosynthesis